MPAHTDPSHMHPERPWLGQPTQESERHRSSLGGIAVKPPDIVIQLTKLEREVNATQEMVVELRSRIGTILRPTVPNQNEDAPQLKEPPPETELGHSINERTESLKIANASLRDILSHIEL